MSEAAIVALRKKRPRRTFDSAVQQIYSYHAVLLLISTSMIACQENNLFRPESMRYRRWYQRN
jgi:hypothetical protein